METPLANITVEFGKPNFWDMVNMTECAEMCHETVTIGVHNEIVTYLLFLLVMSMLPLIVSIFTWDYVRVMLFILLAYSITGIVYLTYFL